MEIDSEAVVWSNWNRCSNTQRNGSDTIASLKRDATPSASLAWVPARIHLQIIIKPQPLSAAKYGILPRSDYTRRDFGLAGTLQTSSTNYLFTRILAKRSTASLKHRKLGAPKPFLDPANELERLQTHRKCPPRVAGEIKKAITHEQAQTAQTFNFAEIQLEPFLPCLSLGRSCCSEMACLECLPQATFALSAVSHTSADREFNMSSCVAMCLR